jgi:hypothetical protein
MGKHGAKSGVTDATNVRNLRSIFGIDDNTATLIELQTNIFEAKSASVWSTTNGNENNIRVQLFVHDLASWNV